LMPLSLLTGAIGISRSTGDVARIAGALTGATLFALFGIGFAYVAVLSLYLAGLLLTMIAGRFAVARVRPAGPDTPRRSPWRELGAGLSYVWRTPHLQGGMWLAVLANLTAFPLTGGLMPYIARDVYGLDKTGLGFMIASFATGALLGSLTVGAIGRRLRLGRTMLISSAIWHLLLLGFVHAPGAMGGAAFLVLAGFAQSISMVSLAAMLLRTSTPDYHGRIMGVRMLSTYSLPLGLLILGALVENLGFATTASLWVLLGAVLTVAIAMNWRATLWAFDAPANQR
jgi:Na+/melibiose symporter-like transporter